MTLKHVPPKRKVNILTFFDVVTQDGVGLARGHRRLRRAHICTPDTIHAASWAMIQLDPATLPVEASGDRLSRNLTFGLTLGVISDLQIKCCHTFQKFMPGLTDTVL